VNFKTVTLIKYVQLYNFLNIYFQDKYKNYFLIAYFLKPRR